MTMQQNEELRGCEPDSCSAVEGHWAGRVGHKLAGASWRQKLAMGVGLVLAALLCSVVSCNVEATGDAFVIILEVNTPGLLSYEPDTEDAGPSAIDAEVADSLARYLSTKRTFILIDKSDRRLTWFENGAAVWFAPVAIGRSPADKVMQGDKATPEGAFYVCTINHESEYRISYGLSYPNHEDAERGLRRGLISESQRRDIDDALTSRRQPPWGTRLGGEIMIHGPWQWMPRDTIFDYAVGLDLRDGSLFNWTAGCIAVGTADLGYLDRRICRGTPVLVRR